LAVIINQLTGSRSRSHRRWPSFTAAMSNLFHIMFVVTQRPWTYVLYTFCAKSSIIGYL